MASFYWYKKNGKTIDQISKLFKKRRRDIKSILDAFGKEDTKLDSRYIDQISFDYQEYKRVCGERKLAYTKIDR